MKRDDSEKSRWLLLVHQIPPRPAYFRAKVGRRLQRIGAVALKNSVYVLPLREQTQEDFQWVVREIIGDGGEATLCAASLVEGLRDAEVEALFQAARQADYEALAREVRSRGRAEGSGEAELERFTKRVGEIIALDFFDAPGREAAEAAIATLARRVRRPVKPVELETKPTRAAFQKRTWVTRKNVHIDRIASAWLIRRFIDPKAKFKLVVGQGYEPGDREVTFDMFEATFTHVGDRCTFEVLIDAFALDDPALGPIAAIIHDIDVKDHKHGRPEVAGIAALIAGLSLAEPDDLARIATGSSIFDALYELYRVKRTSR